VAIVVMAIAAMMSVATAIVVVAVAVVVRVATTPIDQHNQ
jgi:hypothetical protein